jgi:hypothetical protein
MEDGNEHVENITAVFFSIHTKLLISFKYVNCVHTFKCVQIIITFMMILGEKFYLLR